MDGSGETMDGQDDRGETVDGDPFPASATGTATRSGDAAPDHGDGPGPIRQALWFGPPHRRLFGWLHLPASGRASVGVVLCPSLSVEAASAGPAFRRLADLLAAAGMAAFRFDYDGTGNSAGSDDDPDRVAAWTGSVSEAVAFVRGIGLRVAVVGLRVGGTLAAAALDGTAPPAEGLVLWDPCPSGRTFLRQQQVLASGVVRGPRRDDGSVEAPGMVFAPQTAADLRALRIDRTTGPLASRVLVLTRRDRPVDQAMADHLSGAHVTWDVVDGQDTLVDVEPIAAKVPEADLDRIVAWLAAEPEAPVVPVTRAHDDRAIVGTDDRGRPIVERPVTLAGGRIFSMVTEPGGNSGDAPERRTTGGTVVVFLNAGVLDHTGPSRLWVEWSRRWAGLGLRCARFDLPGNGESPAPPGWSGPPSLAPGVADDIDRVLSDLTGGNPADAVLVGLCSGGFHAFHAARRQRVRAVCTINPSFSMSLEEIGRLASTPSRTGHVPVVTQSWARRLPVHGVLSSVVERLPSSAWWVLNRIAVVDAPASMVLDVIRRGTRVFVAVNEPDARLLRRGGVLALARAARRQLLNVEVVDDLDHTLFGWSARDRVTEVLTAYLAAHVAPGGN